MIYLYMFLAESQALDFDNSPLGIEVFFFSFLVYGSNLVRSAVDHSVSGTPRGTNRHPPDADWKYDESSEPNILGRSILIDFF